MSLSSHNAAQQANVSRNTLASVLFTTVHNLATLYDSFSLTLRKARPRCLPGVYSLSPPPALHSAEFLRFPIPASLRATKQARDAVQVRIGTATLPARVLKREAGLILKRRSLAPCARLRRFFFWGGGARHSIPDPHAPAPPGLGKGRGTGPYSRSAVRRRPLPAAALPSPLAPSAPVGHRRAHVVRQRLPRLRGLRLLQPGGQRQVEAAPAPHEPRL